MALLFHPEAGLALQLGLYTTLKGNQGPLITLVALVLLYSEFFMSIFLIRSLLPDKLLQHNPHDPDPKTPKQTNYKPPLLA